MRPGISHRFEIMWAGVCAVFALVAFSAPAEAQSRVQCRATETQAECHARLKCKPNEELEACQKRLLRCKADEDLATCEKRAAAEADPERSGGERRDGQNPDRGGDDRGGDDRGGDDRGREDRRDDDRGDDGRDDRGGDRGDRGRDGGDDRRRQRGQRGGRRGGGGGGSRGFVANKTFGLGLELGEPSGLTGKYFLSDSTALDFGLGWIYRHYYYGDGLHLYADVLFHPVSLVSSQAFELPLYIGVGARFWDFDYCHQGVCTYGGSAVGLRIPFGIAFDFNEAPLDIFLQLVPVIDFVRGDYYDRYRDRAHFGVDLSVGIRFWFK